MSDNPAVEAVERAAENRRVALLIATLALALALTEVTGDDAKTEAQMKNVESANLWAFFQGTVKLSRDRQLRGNFGLLRRSRSTGPELRPTTTLQKHNC